MACRLCTKNSELRNSHIIPESLYKPLYDEKHRAIHLSDATNSQNYKKRNPLQKGLREKLLCHDCEQLLNARYEKYYRELWFDENALPKTLGNGSSFTLRNIDYHKFKLFHLSILFRAGVSSLYEFRHVTLGPHEERLREMIFNDMPTSDRNYAILCHAITKNQTLGDRPRFIADESYEPTQRN